MISSHKKGLTRYEGWSYIDWANEVFIAHQNIGHGEAEKDGQDPGAHKTFNSLLGGDLDKLRAAKSDTTDVGKDVVGNDKRYWKEEPDHAFKNIVHDEMRLHDNQVERHMSPGKLGELKTVVPLFKRCDEENEACIESTTYPYLT